MRGARKWLGLEIMSHHIPVFLVVPHHVYLREDPNETNLGYFDSDAPRIALSIGQTDNSIKECLLHEMSHAIFYYGGIDHNYFCNSARIEERFIRAYSPILFSALNSAKILRLPKIRRFLEAA